MATFYFHPCFWHFDWCSVKDNGHKNRFVQRRWVSICAAWVCTIFLSSVLLLFLQSRSTTCNYVYVLYSYMNNLCKIRRKQVSFEALRLVLYGDTGCFLYATAANNGICVLDWFIHICCGSGSPASVAVLCCVLCTVNFWYRSKHPLDAHSH